MLAAAGALCLIVLAGWATFSKWIRTSPPGFTPVIKVSSLDLVQVWSLRRSANSRAAAGDADGALNAWEAALANNRADLETWRGLLEHIAASPGLSLERVDRTLLQLGQFRRLAGGSEEELQRVASLCNRLGLPDQVCEVVLPMPENPPVVLEREYLKAMLLLEQPYEFAARYEALNDPSVPDPDWDLHATAYLAGWGPVGEREAHRRRLQAALDDAGLKVTAAGLESLLSGLGRQESQCRRALGVLQAAGRDRFAHHARLWGIITASGRTGEARELERAYAGEPRTPLDATALAGYLVVAGDSPQLARKAIARLVTRFGDSRSPASLVLWATSAEILIREREWSELEALAERALGLSEAREALAGYARFLEGYSAARKSEDLLAKTRFQMAVKRGFPAAFLGVEAAWKMLDAGYPELALQTLESLESRLPGYPRYWLAKVQVLMELRQDEQSLLEAARRGLELEPESVVAKVNHAAALLIRRSADTEALKYTLDASLKLPNSLPAQINHAMALAQCKRVDEAAAILNRIPAGALKDVERSSYYTAWLEVHSRTRQWPQARQDLAEINRQWLFPTQLRWIAEVEATLDGLPAKTDR